MKIKVKLNEETGNILVTKEVGLGFPGGTATVEIRPGECYGDQPYRRLKRWCGDNGECEREIQAPKLPDASK